jgi:hypothetical protein
MGLMARICNIDYGLHVIWIKVNTLIHFFIALEVIWIRSWELRVIGIRDYGLCVFGIED